MSAAHVENGNMLSHGDLTLSSNVVQDNIPVEIIPGVYLGSVHAAFNQQGLCDCGITHVINVAGIPATFPNLFTYLTISLRDKENSNLLSCIPACNIFLECATKKDSKVLVHCSYGRSRSPAIVIAYMMNSLKLGYQEAFQIVKKKRNVVNINMGFEMQLQAYEESNYNIHVAYASQSRDRLNTAFKMRSKILSMLEGIPRERITKVAKSIPQLMVIRKSPRVRLQQPGESDVQVMPPLRSMDIEYVCKNCNEILFYSCNIIKPMQLKSPKRLSKRCSSERFRGCKKIERMVIGEDVVGSEACFSKTVKDEPSDFNDTTCAPFVPPTPSSRRGRGFSAFDEEKSFDKAQPKTAPRLMQRAVSEGKETKRDVPLLDFSSRNSVEEHSWMRWMHDLEHRNNSETKQQSTQIKEIADEDKIAAKVLYDDTFWIEPLSWIAYNICPNENSGSLSCCNCDHVVGEYCWDGTTTSWGETVTPAFQIFSKNVGGRERPTSAKGKR